MGQTTARLLRALALGALALALLGCHRSSVAAPLTSHDFAVRDRCDGLLDPQEEAVAQMGGWLRCDPSYDADEQSHCPPTFRCSSVVQWNRQNEAGEREPWAWAWADNLDGHALELNAWMLVGEVYAYRSGRIPAYYLETLKAGVPPEVFADAYAFAVAQVGA